MKEISLGRGYIAIIDDQDFELINQYKWFALVRKGKLSAYAQANSRKPNGKKTVLKMHRLIMGLTDPKILVDHIDQDGLNNRRANLRTATSSENNRNRKVIRTSLTGTKGVKRDGGRFVAHITISGKYVHLGSFGTIVEASDCFKKVYSTLYPEDFHGVP